MNHYRKSQTKIESLEPRRYFAVTWSDAYKVVSQDKAAASFPNVTGAGTTIAIMDTGVDYMDPQLGGGFGPGFKVKGGFDFVDNDSDPMDTFGHGTANAGLMAAMPYDVNGVHYQGIAPDASIIALRVSDGVNSTSYQTIDLALKWLINNYQAMGISVVNFSFGAGRFTTPQFNATVSTDFQTLANDGIVFFSPSGNSGGDGILYPAADANVVSVGSVATDDTISTFTQRGSLLDMLAPGEGLESLGLNNTFVNVTDSSYCSPIAAGAAALLKQVDPKMGRNDIISALESSGVGITDSGITYPRIDLFNAITMAMARKPDANSDVGVNGVANDMAYDKNGVLSFAYYDQALHTIKYATRSTSGVWSATQIVDNSGNDVGATLSLAVDSLGRPAIAYYDATNGDLDYAHFDGSTWTHTALDTKNIVGQFASLAFDSSNNPIIAYYRKTSGDLRVMRMVNSAWVRDEVDTGGDVGQFDSLSISSSGTVGVAYSDDTNGALKYAQLNSGIWTPETVDDLQGIAAFVSLAFDHNNAPAISYYDAYPADLKYATKSTGAWVDTAIVRKGAVGLFTNLWFDSTGAANIVYFSRKSNALFRVHGAIDSLAADTLSLLGGSNAAVAPNAAGTAATYSWFNAAKNKIYTGDVS